MEIIKKVQEGIVTKYLLSVDKEYAAEIVSIQRPEKNIICFSTMVGCPVGCVFCISGIADSYVSNLSAQTMLDMIDIAESELEDRGKPIVYSAMGEGEPFLSIDNVIEVFLTLDEYSMLLQRETKFAVSTSAPNEKVLSRGLTKLNSLPFPVKVQYSLHSATERKKLIRGSVVETKVVLEHLTEYSYPVELNVTLIQAVNDLPQDTIDIGHLLSKIGTTWHIKLNRYNPIAHKNLYPANPYVYKAFVDHISSLGHIVEYYETDGSDINAACGQLHYEELNKRNSEMDVLIEDVKVKVHDISHLVPPYTPSNEELECRKNMFMIDLASVINKYSKESGSNTPDFILADYLNRCLENFNATVAVRNSWYGIDNDVPVSENLTDPNESIPHPEIGSVWRHKNGKLYTVRGMSNIEPGRQDEYPTMVEYESATGEKYSKKLTGWYANRTLVHLPAN